MTDLNGFDGPAGADAGSTDANAGVDGSPDAGDDLTLGSGKDGPLDVTAAGAIVNAYVPILAQRSASAFDVAADAPMRVGDLVLVWRVIDGVTFTPAERTAIDLSASNAGTYAFARIRSFENGALEVDRAISGNMSANAQIIRVPEHTDIVVRAGASITAAPWDGKQGGIAVLAARGSITVNGMIDVSGKGFRGAAVVSAREVIRGCEALDGEPLQGYADKGEGLSPRARRGGRGNAANGGGGGNCHNAGGGGGGHAGRGGDGGHSWTEDGGRDVGGLGGSALVYDPRTHLVMGGGGGAGEQDEPEGSADGGGGGGQGGGVVFVRADAFTIAGSGSIRADGTSAAKNGVNGGGGGGAGGLIAIEVKTMVCTGEVRASGGKGASVDDDFGPGGGGGAGRIAVPGSCTNTMATGGVAGEDGSSVRGAEDGQLSDR